MHDAFLRFLFKAPLGWVQTGPDGTIEAINRRAATLLAPVRAEPGANLFTSLADAAPTLAAQVSGFAAITGTIREELQVTIPAVAGSGARKALSLGVFKVDGAHLLLRVGEAAVPRSQAVDPERIALAKELRVALAENRLYVQYQPIVGLAGMSDNDFGLVDRSAGIEALVRWNHRIRGAIRPGNFIGIAEEYGMIEKLGEFVLRTACAQFVQWQSDLGSLAPRLLAVNLSRGQLASDEFVESVNATLNSTGMPPSSLQLEVNEGLVAQDSAMQDRLRELKKLGIRLALDNFGTGNSSLANLHRLPVDVIKIDRSFTSDAVANQQRRVLIQATIRVAKSLQIHAGAEGIETEPQLTIMRDLGCGTAQGFFFSEAMSAANLAQWVSTEDTLM